MVTLLGATMRTMSAAQLLEVAEQMRRDSMKPVRGAKPDSAQLLKAAVKQRLAGSRANRVTASAASASDEDFGEKLKQAVQKHPQSKEQAQKNAERERSRYRAPQLRPHSKSD